MKMAINLMCIFMLLVLFFSPQAAMAATKTLSGTVTYKGQSKGRVYIVARSASSNIPTNRSSLVYGTSIAEPGAFEIRGVDDVEEYEISAFMDTRGDQVQRASNPASPIVFLQKGVSGSDLALKVLDQTGVNPQHPDLMVYPQEQGLLVWLRAYFSNNYRYLPPDGVFIQWSTDDKFRSGYGIDSGEQTVPCLSYTHLFMDVKKGSRVFLRAAPVTAGIIGAFAPALGPFVVGEAVDGESVSGAITIPKKFVGQRLVVIGRTNKETRATAITATTTKMRYRISGLTGENVSINGFVDTNGNGMYDNDEPRLLPSGSNFPARNLEVSIPPAANPIAEVTIDVDAKRYPGLADRYELYFHLSTSSGVAQATIESGPGVTAPIDMYSLPYSGYHSSYYTSGVRIIVPAAAAGDSYSVKITYTDGHSERKTAVVTGVPAFAVPIEPTGLISDDQEMRLHWKRGDVVLYSPFSVTMTSVEGYTTWSENQVMTSYSDDYFLDGISFYSGYRYNWTVQSRDNFNNTSSVTSTYYYGTGSLTSTITDVAGIPAAGVTASLEDFETQTVVQEKTTGDNGDFLFTDLIPGRYRLCFQSTRFARQCPEVQKERWEQAQKVFVVYPGDSTIKTITLFDPKASPPSASVVLNGGEPVAREKRVPISITASDNSSLQPHVKFYWDDDSYLMTSSSDYPSEVTIPSQGRHILYTTFKDDAGNESTVASVIILDSVGPVALLEKRPDANSAATSSVFTLRPNDLVVYRASLDGGAYSDEIPIHVPFAVSGLSYGIHTFSVIGRDAAGNWQEYPTEYVWRVDVPKAVATVSTAGKSRILAVGGDGTAAYRYRLGYGSYSKTFPVSKRVTIRKDFSGIISIIGRSVGGTWQAVPTTLSVTGI